MSWKAPPKKDSGKPQPRKEPARENTEKKEPVLWRTLRDEEIPEQGLFAKLAFSLSAEKQPKEVTLEQHVQRKYKNTLWISVSFSLAAQLKYNMNPKTAKQGRIVAVFPGKVEETPELCRGREDWGTRDPESGAMDYSRGKYQGDASMEGAYRFMIPGDAVSQPIIVREDHFHCEEALTDKDRDALRDATALLKERNIVKSSPVYVATMADRFCARYQTDVMGSQTRLEGSPYAFQIDHTYTGTKEEMREGRHGRGGYAALATQYSYILDQASQLYMQNGEYEKVQNLFVATGKSLHAMQEILRNEFSKEYVISNNDLYGYEIPVPEHARTIELQNSEQVPKNIKDMAEQMFASMPETERQSRRYHVQSLQDELVAVQGEKQGLEMLQAVYGGELLCGGARWIGYATPKEVRFDLHVAMEVERECQRMAIESTFHRSPENERQYQEIKEKYDQVFRLGKYSKAHTRQVEQPSQDPDSPQDPNIQNGHPSPGSNSGLDGHDDP